MARFPSRVAIRGRIPTRSVVSVVLQGVEASLSTASLEDTTATYIRDPAEILADVANVTAGPGELRPVLERLAELTLEASGADRVSFFLVDENRTHLKLWTATGRRPNEQLWRLSIAMPPIPLDDVLTRRKLFDSGEPVAVEDARNSELIPRDWADAFELASLVVAPLRCNDDTLGLLVADYHKPRSLPPELVGLVGAVARSSALAVGNAWLSAALVDRAAGLQSLVDATRSLLSPRSLTEVAEQVAEAIMDVLDAPHLSVHLLDEHRRTYQTLVQRGVALPESGDLSALSRRATARVMRAWQPPGPLKPVVLTGIARLADATLDLPQQLGCALVLPLARPGSQPFGFVVVGLESRSPPAANVIELAGALASHVAFAVERAQLNERVAIAAQYAEALLSLTDIERDDHGGLLADLRDMVPPAVGFEVLSVRLLSGHPSRRTLLGATREEREVWRLWRQRRTRPEILERDARCYAAVWGNDRAVGLIAVRPLRGSLAAHERRSLEALASALGEAVERHEQRESAKRREREFALAEERADVAGELRALVGRVLEAIESEANDIAQAGDSVQARKIIDLARIGRWELHQTEDSLDALDTDADGLEPALSGVVAKLGARLGVAADLEVRGAPRPLAMAVEQALVRIVHEALSRVEEQSRASAIAVRLEFRTGEVELLVRDDGVTLGGREPGDGRPGPHVGLRLMERRLALLGGRLVVERPAPRGLLLRATVPA